MRPRTEAFIGLAALSLLSVGALLAGRAHGPAAATVNQQTPSTFLTDPGGARGFLEGTQRLGIDVLRFRERPIYLYRLNDRTRQLLVILDPSKPFSAPDVPVVLGSPRNADLLVAGSGAENIIRCLGYKIEPRIFDSVRVDGDQKTAPFIHAALVATHQATYTDSSRTADVGRIDCKVPVFASVHTLLGSPRGPVALRLVESSGRQVILVADAALFSNHALRTTDAGTFALGLVAGKYDHVVFDEYHHGYGAAGSLGKATLEWSLHSPWGWAAWQLAAAGILALLFGAIRFGPVHPGIPRARRSPLEHVRALATALSAARGHDQAIAAIVRGLRRRLAPAAMRSRGDSATWLAHRNHRAASAQERQALATLTTLTQPGQPASSVLQAADAVEDLWQSLPH